MTEIVETPAAALPPATAAASERLGPVLERLEALGAERRSVLEKLETARLALLEAQTAEPDVKSARRLTELRAVVELLESKIRSLEAQTNAEEEDMAGAIAEAATELARIGTRSESKAQEELVAFVSALVVNARGEVKRALRVGGLRSRTESAAAALTLTVRTLRSTEEVRRRGLGASWNVILGAWRRFLGASA